MIKMNRMFSAVLILCMLLLPFQAVNAELAEIAPGLYQAGIATEQFQFFAAPEGYGRQRSANWCWAACIQMVLNFHGLPVTQEAIVAKVYGQLIDQPAGPEQIIYALNGWGVDISGRPAVVMAQPYQLDGPSVVRDLAYRWPLIVGLKGEPIGHAYVLTAVTYRVDPRNNPVFQSVVLRDPWPGNQSRIELSWQEFQARSIFMTRVHVMR